MYQKIWLFYRKYHKDNQKCAADYGQTLTKWKYGSNTYTNAAMFACSQKVCTNCPKVSKNYVVWPKKMQFL